MLKVLGPCNADKATDDKTDRILRLRTMGRRQLRNLERQQMWSQLRTRPAQRLRMKSSNYAKSSALSKHCFRLNKRGSLSSKFNCTSNTHSLSAVANTAGIRICFWQRDQLRLPITAIPFNLGRNPYLLQWLRPNPPQSGGTQKPGEGPPSPLSWRIGAAEFTPGGWADITGVFRSSDTGSGTGTSFGSIPFNNQLPQGALTEFRATAQTSRVSMKVDANVTDSTSVTGYAES